MFHCLCHVSPLYLKQPKQVFFNVINIFDSFTTLYYTIIKYTFFSFFNLLTEFLTKTPIIQDILGASSQGARRFGKTDAGKAARKRMRKAGNAVEDAREVWETSQNPYIYQMASAYDAVFAETEEGQAIKELRRLGKLVYVYMYI